MYFKIIVAELFLFMRIYILFDTKQVIGLKVFPLNIAIFDCNAYNCRLFVYKKKLIESQNLSNNRR